MLGYENRHTFHLFLKTETSEESADDGESEDSSLTIRKRDV